MLVEIDFAALSILLPLGAFFFILWRWSQRFESPRLKFSNLADLRSERRGWRERYARLPFNLGLLALGLFALAYLDPHYYMPRGEGLSAPPVKQTNLPTEGIAIYLVLDQSSSMSRPVTATSPEGRRESVTKMELLKQVTRDFVKGNPETGLHGRPNDLIGLVSFARGAQVVAPLTLDHEAILEQLGKLEDVKDPQKDGTAMGYAIFKTANLIAATRHYAQELTGAGKPAYEIKNAIMILVTDGFPAPSSLDEGKRLRNIELPEAAAYARRKGIRLYVVNVEPRIASETFAAHRKMMKSIADTTGGRFYFVEGAQDLSTDDRARRGELAPTLGPPHRAGLHAQRGAPTQSTR